MATYTSVDSVQRVLRTSVDGRIRLSPQALEQVRVYRKIPNRREEEPVNTVSVDYRSIEISDSYRGKTRLTLVFTSATEFDVYEVDTTLRQELPIGNGEIALDFVTSDGMFTIPAGTIGGTIDEGVHIDLVYDCHISVDEIGQYIEDAEVEIDMILSEMHAGAILSGNNRVYMASGDVPGAVSVAAQYLASYYVYTDVFQMKFKDEESFKLNYSNRWKKRAEEVLRRFAVTERRSIPRVISFKSYVDKFGLESAGPGAEAMQRTVATITADTESEQIFEPGGIDEPT